MDVHHSAPPVSAGPTCQSRSAAWIGSLKQRGLKGRSHAGATARAADKGNGVGVADSRGVNGVGGTVFIGPNKVGGAGGEPADVDGARARAGENALLARARINGVGRGQAAVGGVGKGIQRVDVEHPSGAVAVGPGKGGRGAGERAGLKVERLGRWGGARCLRSNKRNGVCIADSRGVNDVGATVFIGPNKVGGAGSEPSDVDGARARAGENALLARARINGVGRGQAAVGGVGKGIQRVDVEHPSGAVAVGPGKGGRGAGERAGLKVERLGRWGGARCLRSNKRNGVGVADSRGVNDVGGAVFVGPNKVGGAGGESSDVDGARARAGENALLARARINGVGGGQAAVGRCIKRVNGIDVKHASGAVAVGPGKGGGIYSNGRGLQDRGLSRRGGAGGRVPPNYIKPSIWKIDGRTSC